jgi:hypothetical protein
MPRGPKGEKRPADVIGVGRERNCLSGGALVGEREI